MDPSTNTPVNGAQHANSQSYNSILDGIQSFAGSDTLQNGEDISRFFDPELFESTVGNGFSQPSLSMSQDFDTNTSRQSHTPDINPFNTSQQNYSQHQFSQPFYNAQQMNQSTFDPRFYSRPSASPVGFDAGYSYQPQMNYAPQHFSAQQLNIPHRQTPTPTQNYPPRQQSSPFVNIAQRPSQLSHVQVRQRSTALLKAVTNSLQAPDMRFNSFQIQDPSLQSNRFVDPSMLTADQNMNTSMAFQ